MENSDWMDSVAGLLETGITKAGAERFMCIMGWIEEKTDWVNRLLGIREKSNPASTSISIVSMRVHVMVTEYNFNLNPWHSLSINGQPGNPWPISAYHPFEM